MRIEGITTNFLVEEIDDGDDIDEDSDEFELGANRKKTVEFEFDIPIKIDEGSYDLKITAKGDDENDSSQSDSVSLKAEFAKDNHKLMIYKAELTPAEVNCGGKAELMVGILNVGTNDENVELNVINTNLEIDTKQEFSISEDLTDEDSNVVKYITLSIPNPVKVTYYPIIVRATYNTDDTVQKVLELTVKDCKPGSDTSSGNTGGSTGNTGTGSTSTGNTSNGSTNPDNSGSANNGSGSTHIADVPTANDGDTDNLGAQPTNRPAIKNSKPFWDDNKWIVIILVFDILLLAMIFLLIKIARK